MKVLIADKVDGESLDILKQNNIDAEIKVGLSEDEIARVINDYDGIIVRSGVNITKKIIDAGSNLKVIGRAGVGVDNIDVESATSRGIIVMNTPWGNTNSAAEHTVAMILALSRHIPRADRSMKQKLWERKNFQGNEIRGKKIGIIGLGNIGKIVAKILISFGAEILGYDPFLTEAAAKEMDVSLADLEYLLKNSDYITIHVPLNNSTRNLIGSREMQLMKKGAKIINVARGGIIDENALYDSLKNGKIGGAAIDVWETEPPKEYRLAELDNVIATPHLGASTEEAQKLVAKDIATQIADYLINGAVNGAVNFHSVKGEEYSAISDYIKLMENLGSICMQISEGGIERIEVHYRGGIAQHDTKILTNYAVKGVLKNICECFVNEVNSLSVASARNIKVVDSSSTQTENFSNLVRVIITTDKGSYKVNGTVFDGKQERIVKINEYDIDIRPGGSLIVTQNFDVPGVIGQIGSILGSHNINIARMAVGRDSKTGRSLNVTTVDNEVGNDVLELLKKAKNVSKVKLIKL